jgi:hypothetical protein
MGLKAFVDNLDGIDTVLQTLYVKDANGKFRLDADGVEDVTGLKSALEKERKDRKTATDALREFQERFKDIDPDQTRAIMGRVANDEEARLIAEGKIDQVIEKRTEKQRSAQERMVKEANTKTEQAEARSKKFSQRVLDDQIRAAASKAGLHSHAIDDALFRGRAMFSLDEDGTAVQLGEDGHAVLGKDGKSNFGPSEWLLSMKETAPHWFPSGATGGGAGNSGAGNPQFRGTDLSKLPPRERLTAARAAQRK